MPITATTARPPSRRPRFRDRKEVWGVARSARLPGRFGGVRRFSMFTNDLVKGWSGGRLVARRGCRSPGAGAGGSVRSRLARASARSGLDEPGPDGGASKSAEEQGGKRQEEDGHRPQARKDRPQDGRDRQRGKAQGERLRGRLPVKDEGRAEDVCAA